MRNFNELFNPDRIPMPPTYKKAVEDQKRLFRNQREIALRAGSKAVGIAAEHMMTLLEAPVYFCEAAERELNRNGERVSDVVQGRNPVNDYMGIAKRLEKLEAGEFTTYYRNFGTREKPLICRIDFYPKGVVARSDIPMSLKKPKGKVKNLYSMSWRPDYQAYQKLSDDPKYKVIQEIVGLDESLTNADHHLRFFKTRQPKMDAARENYTNNVINNYTSSGASVMLIRDPDSRELIGLITGMREVRNRSTIEVGMELRPNENRGHGIGKKSLEDMAGILYETGKVKTLVGSYLFDTDTKNMAMHTLLRNVGTDRRSPLYGMSVQTKSDDLTVKLFGVNLGPKPRRYGLLS